jgi:hypothetical protein
MRSPTPAPLPAAPASRPARRGAVRPVGPAARPGLPAVLAVLSGAMVVAIHTESFPYPLQQQLRDWALHLVAMVAATVFTAALLGHRRRGSDRHQRLRLTIACTVPLAITLLHETGQWLWPPGARDAFDSVRDALLNVAGTAVACWSLRRRPAAPQAR